MVLKSDLLKKNDKLKDCEIKDSAHIVADEPPKRRGVNNKGPHVALLHRALRKVMSSPKFGLEEPNEEYGPLTAEVVRQFKLGPPMILNKALGQTTPDNIVGKQTIKELDRQVALLEGKEIPDLPIPPIDPSSPFHVVPFDEPAPFLIFRQSHNPAEDDLDIRKRQPTISLSVPQQQKLGVARTMGKTLCEQAMLFELKTAAGSFGEDMANRFFRNPAVGEITFGPTEALTQRIQKSPTFLARLKELTDNISAVLRKGILQRKECDYHDLAENKKTVDFELPSFPFLTELVLKATIGGMKGADVFLSKFDAFQDTKTWTGTLQFVLFDHFGINDSDLIFEGGHGTQGQVCMWVLQHEHRPGHCPFISKFVFGMNVTGSL